MIKVTDNGEESVKAKPEVEPHLQTTHKPRGNAPPQTVTEDDPKTTKPVDPIP